MNWEKIDIDSHFMGYQKCQDQVKEQLYKNLLHPLILENYAARERGELPDEWFWADDMGADWGWFTTNKPEYHKPKSIVPIDWDALWENLGKENQLTDIVEGV